MSVCWFWTCFLEECSNCPYIFYPGTIIGSSNIRISNIGISFNISRRVTVKVWIFAVWLYSYLKRISFGLCICYNQAPSIFPIKWRLSSWRRYTLIPFLIKDYFPMVKFISLRWICLESVTVPIISELSVVVRRISAICTLDYVLSPGDSSTTNRINLSYYVFASHNYA